MAYLVWLLSREIWDNKVATELFPAPPSQVIIWRQIEMTKKCSRRLSIATHAIQYWGQAWRIILRFGTITDFQAAQNWQRYDVPLIRCQDYSVRLSILMSQTRWYDIKKKVRFYLSDCPWAYPIWVQLTTQQSFKRSSRRPVRKGSIESILEKTSHSPGTCLRALPLAENHSDFRSTSASSLWYSRYYVKRKRLPTCRHSLHQSSTHHLNLISKQKLLVMGKYRSRRIR